MKIKYRLFFGFGTLGVLALLLGVASIVKMRELSNFTEQMYRHPLVVGNAVREIKANFTEMRYLLEKIPATADKEQLDAIIEHIDVYEKKIYASFDVVLDRFLGDKREVKAARRLFSKWKPIRDEVIRRKQERESMQSLKPALEKEAVHSENLNEKIQGMIEFANAKANELDRKAENIGATLLRNTVIFIALVSVFVVVMTFLMNRNIVSPLQKLNKTAQSMSDGDMSARSRVERRDELGSLSRVLDTMADFTEQSISELEKTTKALSVRQFVQEGMLAVSNTLAVSPSLDKLLNAGLNELMRATGSQVGAVYLYNDETDELQLACSLGFSGDLPKSVTLGQGSVGLAAMRKETGILLEIPEDTRYLIKTVNGESIPRNLIDVSLCLQDRLIGVLALGSLYSIDAQQLEIIDNSRVQFATAIENARAADKTAKLASELLNANKQLETRNAGLEMQSLELKEQADELRTLNVELNAQRVEVESANRLKSEFLSNMSHELRTPLNSILALSQLMIAKKSGEKTEKDREFLHTIDRNGRHLLNLINDILDLSKIESGKVEIMILEIDIERVVHEALDTIRPIARKKNLELKVDIPVLFKMRTDEHRLRQILTNLLSNAVKFTKCGWVELRVYEKAERVCFMVKDSGIGIAPEQLPHIFSEFRQADGSITRKYGGTGLGLAICKKTAALLGGRISVDSEIGRGSCFTLSLPLEKGRKSTEKKVKRSSGKVLIVEDNEIAAMQIQSAIEDCGFSVAVASGGAAALESIEREIPDAVVLDLMMPEVDGFQVLEMLRADPQTMALPVLVLTAKELNAEEKSRLKNNDIDQLIQKGSIDREQLIAAVAKLLEKVKGPKQEKILPKIEDKTILIVEDNPDNMATFVAVLEELECKIAKAKDGRQALSIAGELRPDLILMDMHLPVLSGFEAVKQIRYDPVLCYIPVIALTARAMAGDRERILAHGCDDYLSKPIEPHKLQKMVLKWLSK